MNILLAVDHVSPDLKAIQITRQYLASMGDVTVTAIYVSSESASVYYKTAVGMQQIVTDGEWAFRNRLEADVAREFRSWGTRVKFRHELGHAAVTICQVADEIGSDLIILGKPRRHGDPARFGSVVHGVLAHANHPVLVAI